MKSKRQEELQKKTPAHLPDEGWTAFFQRNASRILLGLTLAVLAVLIFRYRSATADQREQAAKTAAVRARADLQQLKQVLLIAEAAPEKLAAGRDQLTAQVLSNLSEALADSADSDTSLRADAYAIRGDLYWTLANSPVFAEAATRPSLALKDSPDTLLGEAEADYRHIIEQYPSQLMDWATAEFGLAAIAENRGNWDEASKRYDEVKSRSDAPDMLKSTAQIHLGLLERMRQPILVGPYPALSATTAPSTQISPVTAMSPETVVLPTTVPSTQPAR